MYLYGGSSLQASGTGAPSLLQVEVMKALSEKGIKYYDWHGANTISIIRFKKNFNPRLAPCIVARRNYGLIGNVAHAVKDSLQRWSAGRRIQEDS